MSAWDWTLAQIAWLDVETDGLIKPGGRFPLLLEVALVLTNADLEELGRYEAVIRWPGATLDALRPHRVVADMHARNGLWKALRGPGTVSVGEAESAMLALLDRHATGTPVVWGGFSPAGLDRPVISRYMPSYFERIHYRSVDVSALRLCLQNWAGLNLVDSEAKERTEHRALADTLESIELAQAYRRWLTLAAAERHAAVVERVEIPMALTY